MTTPAVKTPRHLVVAVVLLALALASALTGCSGDDDGASAPSPTTTASPEEATPTEAAPPDPVEEPAEEPVEEPADYRRIPASTRRAYFDATQAQDQQARESFPCAATDAVITDDRNLRDFDAAAFTTGDFAVIRQIALYPSPEEAAETVALTGTLNFCTGGSGSAFDPAEDRFFGVKDRGTLFSEITYGPEKKRFFTIVNVVTVRGNAVMWTRIGSDTPVAKGSVTFEKEANPSWVRTVRSQGNVGVEILASLGATGR